MTTQKRAKTYSIQNRLLSGFSLLLALFLGLTGIVLDRAFRDSIEAGAAEQLQLQIYVLLSAIDEENGEFFLLEDLRERGSASWVQACTGLSATGSRGNCGAAVPRWTCAWRTREFSE